MSTSLKKHSQSIFVLSVAVVAGVVLWQVAGGIFAGVASVILFVVVVVVGLKIFNAIFKK